VIDQNFRAPGDVAEQENSGTDCIPKPDALLVLAAVRQDKSWPTNDDETQTSAF
jgi:hypothetical protein